MQVTFSLHGVIMQFDSFSAQRLGQVAEVIGEYAALADYEDRQSAALKTVSTALIPQRLLNLADTVVCDGHIVKSRTITPTHQLVWDVSNRKYRAAPRK